ncbi:hypothetical protein M436DRAFT_63603 [Aureobasidium namibiae CBS 147.97]|uniref:Uncharacterized protein n=1 Tax=Aureobasidium namibiae CBS 147.97 TaxID=1043004 RepID=A0A074XFA0_9PEZI
MATPAPLDDVMRELKKIPMTKQQFEQTKARIIQSRAEAETNDPLLKIAKMTQNCIKDIRDRLAYIAERREQKAQEEEQRTIAFATALAERNKVKATEKSTKQGQKTHRTRIEVWRDEVKQLALLEKKPTLGTTALKQQNPSLQNTTKRPLDSEVVFFEDLAGTASTPVNKRMKTAAQNDSSSLVAPPTSSKKSIPWLSTRASMADEDVFADDDCHFPNPEIRLHDKKNKRNAHNDNENIDDDDADEDINRDEDDLNSEDSYGSELTELEQMLTIEMAMVGVMTLLLARNNEALRDTPTY